jgi:hypothetical protein
MTSASPEQPRSTARAALIDATFVIVLEILGVFGFRSTFGGVEFLVIGGAAIVLGVGVSYLASRLGQPVLAEIVVALLVFFVLGGLVAARSGSGSSLPTESTLRALATVGVHGWKDLLTTEPPVGDVSNLLVIPYLIGLVGGVAGFSLAYRTRVAALPLLAPVGVLALSILFGTARPASLLLQGSVFALVGLAWIVVRHERNQPMVIGTVRRQPRAVAGIALLAIAALGAQLLGSVLPGRHQRVVLDRYVVPPFEASALASPLSSFRLYTPGAPRSLATTQLFKVTGVTTGTRMRIATMDSYDGLVWGFDGGSTQAATADSGDVFRRYGSTITADVRGESGALTVHIQGLSGVWLPDVGSLRSVSFQGSSSNALTNQFRYDAVTATAAVPSGLSRGDSYTMHVVVPPTPTKADLLSAAPGPGQLAVEVPSYLQVTARKWIGQSSQAWAEVTALATHLKTYGRFSNGTESPPLAAPGQSAGRLTTFLQGGPLVGKQIVGDDEQYAAALALMSNAVGVPARVVLGAVVQKNGEVLGKDVHAWVEVSLAGLGWVTVDPTMFLPTRTPTRKLPRTSPPHDTSVVVAPPTVSALAAPPSNILPQNAPSKGHTIRKRKPLLHVSSGLPVALVDTVTYGGPPIGLIVLAALAIIALKARRRRRRRTVGPPSARFASGWRELLDQARDLGHPVPSQRTRREQARALSGGPRNLALAADAAVFGPDDPSPQQIATYWEAVAMARKDLRRAVGRWRRIWSVVTPASLLSSDTKGIAGQ